jgi:hypothetical protein
LRKIRDILGLVWVIQLRGESAQFSVANPDRGRFRSLLLKSLQNLYRKAMDLSILNLQRALSILGIGFAASDPKVDCPQSAQGRKLNPHADDNLVVLLKLIKGKSKGAAGRNRQTYTSIARKRSRFIVLAVCL